MMVTAMALWASVAGFDGEVAGREVHGAYGDARSCAVLDEGYAVGTTSGLVLLDERGRVQRIVTEFDGLPGARVETVAASPGARTLWIGTEHGVAALDTRGAPSRWRWIDGDPLREHVRRILVDAEGVVWAGTWGAGLFVLDGARDGTRRWAPVTTETEPPPEDAAARGRAARITALAETPDGLLVGTGAGVFRGRRRGHARALVASETPSPAFVQALASSEGTTTVGALGGAWRDGVAISSHDVRDLEPARSTRSSTGMWMATEDGGLVLLDEHGTKSVVADARMRDVDLGEDGRGCAAGPDGVWISRRVDRHDSWHPVTPIGLHAGDLSSLLVDGAERVWAGGFDGGLARLDDGVWRRFPQVHREINVLAAHPQGRGVVVGTADGLFHVDGAAVHRFDEKAGLPSRRVQALAQDLDGDRLLVGTSRGLVALQGGRLQPVAGARQWSIFALAVAPDGAIWVGTTRGLVRLDRRGRKIYYSVLGGHLPDDWITALSFGGDGTLYVGSYSHGVVALRAPEGRWSAAQPSSLEDLSASPGGRYVNIGGLTVARGRVWVSTMAGLHSRPEVGASAGKIAWRHHPQATLGADVTAVAFSSGENAAVRAWVAGRRGLVATDTATLEKNERAGNP